MAQNLGKTTTDHETIRRWAEERGGKPSEVMGTARENDIGMIRIDFPGYSGAGTLREISWDDWFRKFDASNLALVYEDETSGLERSNFNKLIGRETMEARSEGIRTSRRHPAGRRRTASRGGRATAARSRRSGRGSRRGTAARSRSRSAKSGGTSRTSRRGTGRGGSRSGTQDRRSASRREVARTTGRRSGTGAASRKGSRSGSRSSSVSRKGSRSRSSRRGSRNR